MVAITNAAHEHHQLNIVSSLLAVVTSLYRCIAHCTTNQVMHRHYVHTPFLVYKIVCDSELLYTITVLP